MNLGESIAGVHIKPSFKVWWNRYFLKIEIKGNNLIHDAMLIEDIYKFLSEHTWHEIKFAWNKKFTIYLSDLYVSKKFINQFHKYIDNAQGIRTQEEFDVVTSRDKILRHKLFFNKYRYVMHKYYPDSKWTNKVKNLSMNAKVRAYSDGWKTAVYLGNKKDVAKLQLSLGKAEQIYKVVTLEEI